MIDRAVWAARTAFAGTIMNELKSGHKVRCHLTAVDGWAGHRRSGIVCPKIARCSYRALCSRSLRRTGSGPKHLGRRIAEGRLSLQGRGRKIKRAANLSSPPFSFVPLQALCRAEPNLVRERAQSLAGRV